MDVLHSDTYRRRLLVVAAVELLLVAACAVAVWQVWESRQVTGTAAPVSPGSTTAVGTPTPAATPIALPSDGPATAPPAAATSGPVGEASSLLSHLQQFNGLVSSMEGTESTVLQILIPGTVWYLQTVVVPDIEAALHGR